MNRPAILGTRHTGEVIPISEPTLPPFDDYARELAPIFASRQITNGAWVRRLEEEAAAYLGAAEVVAVSCATSGLILVAKLLGLKGKVLLPAFTFPATMHILLWNRLEPVLVDCDPDSFNIDPVAAGRAWSKDVCAVVPVYIFGNAPDWASLDPWIAEKGLSAFSDAAHALGTAVNGRKAGTFGNAEIFSLAPTKVTVAGEGGLIATNDRKLAGELRVARNYGNPGDYDCVTAGLNARESELHALLAVLSLRQTEGHIARRDAIVRRYRDGLAGIAGVSFQKIDDACRSTHNYFAVRIDRERFGLSNRELHDALDEDRIRTKIYFHPPLHRQSRFMDLPGLRGEFPNTDRVCNEVLCLPLFSHMRDDQADRVVESIAACARHAEEIRSALAGRTAQA